MNTEEIQKAVNDLVTGKEHKYNGKDNYGKPKREYLGKLVQMTDSELFEEMKRKIWLSAYANNNPRSDYHWQCDSTYDEGKRRGKPKLYGDAHKQVTKECGY